MKRLAASILILATVAQIAQPGVPPPIVIQVCEEAQVQAEAASWAQYQSEASQIQWNDPLNDGVTKWQLFYDHQRRREDAARAYMECIESQ